ncbi:MAG: BON domain-containing protein [Myxococcaceae bacterium]
MKATTIARGLMLTAALVVSPVLGKESHRPSDAWITTKTKLSILTEAQLPSNSISVDTRDGVVTLHGKVPSEAAKTKATATARAVHGTRDVRNLLQVVATNERMVEARDDALKESIQKQLRADALVKRGDVKIASVNKGVVLLTGSTHTLSESLRAAEIARWTPGVRSVSNNVRVKDEYAQIDWPAGLTDTATTDIPDALTTARVKLALMTADDVPAMSINVDTVNGAVALFGIVPSTEAKASAERAARKVGSVRSVENGLEVVAPERQAQAARTDDALEEDLKKSYSAHDELKQVDVDVNNGVARLTGNINTEWDRFNAVTMARVAGVKSVKDDLRNKK